ncbi:MAG TPA: HEAT repeat domain-containing protein [bacterium]|nr:HEAT repeat domain-containing protein [bacterium]
MKRLVLIFFIIHLFLFSQNTSKDFINVIENLKSQDPMKRVYAAYKIRNMQGDLSESIPYLLNILEDERIIYDKTLGKTTPSDEAKKTIIKIGSVSLPYIFEKYSNEESSKLLKIKLIEILGEIKDKSSQVFIEKCINDRDIEIKEKVIEILSKDKDEVNFLINNSKQDEYIKIKVIRCFGSNKVKESIPFLYEYLKDKNWEIRKYAIWALGEIKEDIEIEKLIPLIKDKEFLVRKEVAETFEKIKNPLSIPQLIELLDDSNWMVRMASVKALGALKDIRGFEPVLNMLNDKQIEVKIEAIKALANFKDKRATVSLISNLNDRYHLLIREYSAYALGEIGDKRAVYSLINLLKSENYELKRIAREALRKITGVDFGYDKEKWYNWAGQNKISSIK